MHPLSYCDITVYGFHGCNQNIKQKLLNKDIRFDHSANRYDWLGSGVYFWENDFRRAHRWAEQTHGGSAAVVGAKISLGKCFDLSNSYAKELLVLAYEDLCIEWEKANTIPIENAPHPHGIGNPSDMVLRYLDKVVIENAISLAALQEPDTIYDTVRAPFQEGFPIYPGSAFREHDHIHLCVRNPDLLTELFDPDNE